MFGHHQGDTRVTVGGHTWTASDRRITMYLFSPQQMPDVSIRPHKFHFDQEFVEDVEKIIDKSAYEYESSYGGNYIDHSLVTSNAINRSVKPTNKGIDFYGKNFEGLWSFLLLIDNAPFVGRSVKRNINNRIMYVGFVMDGEPFSNLTGRVYLNPDAYLVVTHKTYLNVKETSNAAGMERIVVPHLDEDIISTNILQMTTPERGYMLDPKSLVSSHGMDGDGIEVDSPGMAFIGNSTSNLRFDTDLKNPKKQIRSILNGLTKMKLFDKGADEFRPDFTKNATGLRDYSSKREIFAQTLTNRVADVMVGIPVNEPVKLGQIMSEYPSLEHNVEIINLPFDMPIDATDPFSMSPTNIWSSMLQSSLPSLFSYYGISDISFRYCSCNPGSITRLDNNPIWEVQDIGAFIPTSQEDLKVRWEHILDAMEKQVFTILHANCGEFDVIVNYNGNNYCAIQLQLMDIEEYANNGFIVSHGVTNPFTTPIIGREEDRHHNASALDDLIAYVDYSDRSVVPIYR